MRLRSLGTGLVAVFLLFTTAPMPGARPTAGGDLERRTAASGTKVVKMVDDKFKPKSVTVTAGTKIKWINKGDNPHTTTGSGWDTTISSGQSYSRKFKKAGTYNYHCSFHPKMVATVVVTS